MLCRQKAARVEELFSVLLFSVWGQVFRILAVLFLRVEGAEGVQGLGFWEGWGV